MSNTLTVTEIVNSVTVTPVNNTVEITTGISAGSTTTAGILQLTDSISSTSTTTAATPNAVKNAYDFANSRLALLDPISGAYYRTPSAVGGAAQTASVNSTSYTPIFFNSSVTLDRIALHTASSFVGTSSVRLGIFANNGNKPGNLILDAGTVAPSAASTSYAITISQSLSPGIYWLALNTITAASTNNYFGISNAQQTNSMLMGGAHVSTTGSSPASGYVQAVNVTSGFSNASSPNINASSLLTYVRVA
jgi:hypothetical protein